MKQDTAFERCWLADSVAVARTLGAQIRKGWVHQTCNGWEFHYGDFYVFNRAENAYHARALGWDAWVASRNLTNA